MTIDDIKSRVKNSMDVVYRLRKIREPKKKGDKKKDSSTEPPVMGEDFKLDPETLEKIKESLKNKGEGDDDEKLKELLE